MRLQLFPSGIVRRLAGRCIATVMVAGIFTGASSTHAEPMSATPMYAVAMALEAGGKQSAPRIVTKAGEPFAVASGDWRVEMTVRQRKTPADVLLAGKVLKGSTVISAPTRMVHINEKAVIKVSDSSGPLSLSMIVSAP